MGLRDHAMNSKFLLYTDHYRKGTASEESEDREDKCGDNWKNDSQENKDKEVTVEKEDKKGGGHILSHCKHTHWILLGETIWGEAKKCDFEFTITHTQLRIHVVYIMLSVARSVALSGSTHRQNKLFVTRKPIFKPVEVK